MSSRKKVLLFLVEGVSDQTSLALLLTRIFTSNTIKVHIVNGDITSTTSSTTHNVLTKIADHIKLVLKEAKFLPSDISKVIHIVDTDGAYIPDKYITENPTISSFQYTPSGIIVPKLELGIQRNKHKSMILNKISHTPKISISKVNIPYMTLYFSCNLEHVLHNMQNAPDSLKDKLAEDFLDRYIGHEDEFIDFICNSAFSVKQSYLDTWTFIMQDLNSVHRYSNFNLILE